MGVRKNARFLSVTEREDFARACVLMKADIVNPAAPAAQRYSRWDELVAIHRMIQSAFAPGAASVNFGHGGLGRFSFLSWHRYFLHRLELDLQSKVPGVMIPYWDWTDPASIMTDDFLGPDGSIGDEVRSGYFGADAPATGTNPTPSPAWWPAGLTGWRLPDFAGFGTFDGPLRRNLSNVASLPTASDLRDVLDMATYSPFQYALESGNGITNFPAQQLHNGLHGWVGGHMNNPAASPFDPIFYLHHCNIDRLWAMWQVDGHATEYPVAGGATQHHRNDLMYPWHGGAAGYGTNATIAADIPMPDFSALGAVANVDTLDFRALGYTYDSIPIVGLGLDRTGSMLGMTPDPMTAAAPDVTKWEAATRGVSAFLQDCETVQESGVTYVVAGVRTFRRLGPGNDFVNVLPAPGYGLVKAGGTHGRAAFDAAIAAMTPAGSTPLADALTDVHASLVAAPFGQLPAGERRYLAMLTDGIRTSGALMSSIPDGSFLDTAVFGMGFGTGADVDYATIASMVAKGGVTLDTAQVFHGENAGTIDKFYSDALAAAMGFTTVIDPVLELFAGEHAHLDFHATSAEDALLITAQGMDFDDDAWTFMLHQPDGSVLHGDAAHAHPAHPCAHHCCPIDVTARRSNGRLTLVVSRNHADDACWVGVWRLMICYRTRGIGAMVMPVLGELLAPVQAGPPRGMRYSRLLLAPRARVAVRNVHTKAAHALDERVASTQRDDEAACQVLVNVYARTQLRLSLLPKALVTRRGSAIELVVHTDVLRGSVALGRSYARMLAPAMDLAGLLANLSDSDIPDDARMQGEAKFDTAKVLAHLERRNRRIAQMTDQRLVVARHDEGPLHLHIAQADVPGGYHVGMYVEGLYCPDHSAGSPDNHQHEHRHGPTPAREGLPSGCHAGCTPQRFSRILTSSVAVVAERTSRRVSRKAAAPGPPKRTRRAR
jgi:hypothetical protein